MDAGIELADAVEAVREQLAEAVARGEGQAVRFGVESVVLEFGVELKLDAKVKGGVKAWVFTADAEGGVARQRSHKITVTLASKTADGGSVDVGNVDLGSRAGF
ncbi:trypco2 family protein [Kitasatospora sp. NPDC096147]|uniref:trypco2 family protein n=1 Tax=Kitasatospora sp. NPDC096147 TaxID=3364093 RepID=UPI0038097352